MKLFFSIRIYLAVLLVLGQSGGACHKQAFLDKKPSTNLLVPATFTDFQELLDNTQVMGITPVLGEMSTDNFYLNHSFWQSLDIREYNAYIWARDLYEGQGLVPDWDIPYSQVFYANVVLEGLEKITPDSSSQIQWNELEGEALFTRAFAFYNLAELFAPPYDSLTAVSDPGIPLRDTADINVKSVRATVQQTYAQLLGDLRIAVNLLPAAIPVNNLNRPSRLAALALLARIYLSLGDYTDAGNYANSVLQVYSRLVDYNTLDTGANFPVSNNMPEILYQSNFLSVTDVLAGLIYTDCLVDTTLLAAYAPNDLRRPVYYKQLSGNSYYLKGSYAGTIFPFSGLATDELYLIRAECSARARLTGNALTDLDSLMSHRLLTGTFTGYSIADAAAALDTILVERRKELAFRGIRWSDLRRLNKEGRNITLTRNLNGTIYTLMPNSNLYTLPIPPDVLSFNPGMQQNPR
jgi:starch-binding outer membrane protein, SusD/RagB family